MQQLNPLNLLDKPWEIMYLKSMNLFRLFKSKKTYDLYIPFGRSCHCTMLLQHENLRSFSQVFDWLIPDDYALEPIQTRFELFFDFTKFFDINDYTFQRDQITTSGHYNVLHNKFRFVIGHDFDLDKSNEENFKLFKIKYLRRWKRTLMNMERADKICFVYIANTWDQIKTTSVLDTDVVKENIHQLRQKYPQKQIDFIIFEHDANMPKNKISIDKIENGITKYISNHSYREIDNSSDDIHTNIFSIKKVLSEYKLSGKIQQDEVTYQHAQN